jgi:hypothetical protein
MGTITDSVETRLNDNKARVRGEVELVLTSGDGVEVMRRTVSNLTVNTGLRYIASRIINTDNDVMSHMMIGSGTTLPTINDTTLESQLGVTALTSSEFISAVSVHQAKYTATFGAGNGTGSVNEAGIANASSGGMMLCRVVFPDTIPKDAASTLSLTWTVTIVPSS